jgi:uncharacterized membrane protein
MLRKSLLAERGQLAEPSVVQTPRAKLFGGVPNAFIGTLYYTGQAAVSWSAHGAVLLTAAFAVSIAATVTSAFLGYSLLFVTRRSCPYCWTAHAVNFTLSIALLWLLVHS